MNINLLNIEEIIEIHDTIIDTFGGLKGIRDNSLLNSSLERPFTQYGGIELFKSIEEKISSIIHSIIKYHVFIDGNKRTGIQILTITLDINDINISYSQKELVDLAINIASGIYDVLDISNWIIEHE